MEIKTNIYPGDSKECLARLPENSVDLIVTSPPYADQRKNVYGGICPDEYADWFLPILGIVSVDNNNGYYQCAACGKNAQKVLPAWKHWYRANDGKYINRIKDGIEPFFGYPLFYQTGFSGKLIWAINRKHLVYRIAYLEANLREKSGYRYRTQSSVLPRFMKLAKNRARVVKVCAACCLKASSVADRF